MSSVFGAEFRRVENRDHLGKPAIVAVATRTYDTTVEDLWEAVTTPARVARWFAPVEGELRQGGRYQIKGNEMELAIRRADLGLEGASKALRIEFKWADNMQQPGQIEEFAVNGDAAPNGRFNYVYVAPGS